MTRLLLGPGPSMVSPRALASMSQPLLGYLDPQLFEILKEVQQGLRQLFQTQNEVTLALPGTGMSGMECALGNLIEPGDPVLIGAIGFFGERMIEIARRYGAEVHAARAEWGKPLQPEQVEAALDQKNRWKLVACVHAETSTGVVQPIPEIAHLAKSYGALFVMDAVTSLGGLPVKVDEWGVDVCYSATQKCVGSPPGLAPITLSESAWQAIANRSHPNRSWYLDIRLLWDYWNEKRIYHHTTPVSLLYALQEALKMIEEEGREQRFERHRQVADQFYQGASALGLSFCVEPEHRAPTLTSLHIPEGVEDAPFRSRLLNEFGIEIGGGLGDWKGKVWRVGLMGHSCQTDHVKKLLQAMETIMHGNH